MAVVTSCDLCGQRIESGEGLTLIAMDVMGMFIRGGPMPQMSASYNLHRNCYHDSIYVLLHNEEPEAAE